MRVKIRADGNRYLAYFIDSRRIVRVNHLGAIILDLIFNQEKTVEEITNTIASDYSLSNLRIKEDVVLFLEELKNEINPDGFNVIGQEYLDVPLGVELEITTSCNLRCRHCFQSRYDDVFMPTKKVIDIINLLADNSIFEVSLMGGEPFRHEGLFEILKSCEERDMAVNIVTNGTLIDQETIEELSKIKRVVLLVSVDGTEKVHDYIRGQGVFKKVDATLKLLREKNLAVEVLCTLNTLNLPIYKEIVEYCESLNTPCNFNLFKPFKPEHQALIPDPQEFFRVVIDLLELRRFKGYKIGLSNAAIVAELLGLPQRNECRATRSGIVIDINGRMVTCPSLVAAGYYEEGELPKFDNNFAKTWKEHETFTRFRKNGLRECQARSFIYNKDVCATDPYGINAFREYLSSI